MLTGVDTPQEHPLKIAAQWLSDAMQQERCRYPLAACLATVDDQGIPNGRIVLVEQWNDTGFIFSTDSRSTKAAELTHGFASLTFYWDTSERQLRLRGAVQQADTLYAERHIQNRPVNSRITAWASEQSSPISSRQELHVRYNQTAAQFQQKEIARPMHWVSFMLHPFEIEFWTAAPARLHEREQFRKEEEGWTRTILQP